MPQTYIMVTFTAQKLGILWISGHELIELMPILPLRFMSHSIDNISNLADYQVLGGLCELVRGRGADGLLLGLYESS